VPRARHFGEGPFARVVSIREADASYELSRHYLVKREAEANNNPVYRLKIDYNFQAIRNSKGPINMRVDYTNLLEYWKAVTDTPESKKKRSVKEEHMSYRDWRGKVDSAKSTRQSHRMISSGNAKQRS
jgi:superfamily I DNA and/or RNA helicase